MYWMRSTTSLTTTLCFELVSDLVEARCKPCECLCELVCLNECVCICISGGNTSVSVDIVPDIPHPVGCPECNMFCKEQITFNKHTVTHMHEQAMLHIHFFKKIHEL